MKIFSKILLVSLLQTLALSTPLMLEARSDFIESLAKSRIAVFFYGQQNTQEYAAFEAILPSDKELFADSDLEFYFIPSSSVKLSKKQKSLFLYRDIEGNQWLTYKGPFNVKKMSEWVRHHCFDSLPQVKGPQIDDMFVELKSGFILLDMGTFDLLATKIMINDYCNQHKLICRKCGLNNDALRLVVQLMEADDQYGVSKLAFWDAKTSKFDIFTKGPLHKMTLEDLVEMHQGKQGLVKLDTSPRIPESPLTQEETQEPRQQEL